MSAQTNPTPHRFQLHNKWPFFNRKSSFFRGNSPSFLHFRFAKAERSWHLGQCMQFARSTDCGVGPLLCGDEEGTHRNILSACGVVAAICVFCPFSNTEPSFFRGNSPLPLHFQWKIQKKSWNSYCNSHHSGSPCGSSKGFRPAKFIILCSKFLVLNTQFVVFKTLTHLSVRLDGKQLVHQWPFFNRKSSFFRGNSP